MHPLLLKIFAYGCFLFYPGLILSQVINNASIDNEGKLIITSLTAVYKTETPSSIDSICCESIQKKFVAAPNRMVVFDRYNPYYYWFRIVISNSNRSPYDLMLLMAPVGMREGMLFQKKNDLWKMIARNGYILPFTERPYLYADYVFPLSIPPRTTDTLYLSMNAMHAYKSYGFVLIKPKELKLLENKVYFSFGIIVGLLSLFLMFNFYLYFTWRDKIQLWYALYIAMLILVVMKNDQLDQQFFGWDSETPYFMTSIMGIGGTAIAILIHVVQLFLSNIKRSTYLYKISFAVKIVALVSGILQLVVFYTHTDYNIQNTIFFWSRNSTTIGVIIIIVNCIYSLYKGNKSAYFILAGLIVFLIGAFQRLRLLDTPTYFYPPYIFHYGMVIETFTISFGLIYRYRVERSRKTLYQKEKEIFKNNMEKLLLKSKIEIQEQSLKTVFKEINNNVGKNINLVKQNLYLLRSAGYQDADAQLLHAKAVISNSIADLRNLCKSLDTDYIRDIGLLKSIEEDLVQANKSGLSETTLQISGDPYRIESQKELVLFRIYQEIFNELNESDKAGEIKVLLNYGISFFEIVIKYEQRGRPHNLDTTSLRNRAALIGASFEVSGVTGEEAIAIRLII